MNGILFPEQKVDSLIQALDECESLEWDPIAIRRHALKYDINVFQDRFLNFIGRVSPAVQDLYALQRRAG